MVELTRDGSVFVLRLTSGENRFNPGFIAALNGALDEIERSSGDAALVTTGTHEKFFSNGLDLDWLTGEGAAQARTFLPTFFQILGRFLSFPVPTVAAINGHAFAGGGMLALAHDFRFMRADRGFFCLNEVDLGMPLSPGLAALVTNRLGGRLLRDVVLAGKRFGGEECAAHGVVDAAVPQDELLPRALECARGMAGKNRGAYGALKRNIYGEAIAALESGRLP